MSRDFIDVYLKEMQGVTDPNSTFYGAAGGNVDIKKMFYNS